MAEVIGEVGKRAGMRPRLFPMVYGSYFSFSVNLNLNDFLCYFIPHLACYIYKHIVVSNLNVFSNFIYLLTMWLQ